MLQSHSSGTYRLRAEPAYIGTVFCAAEEVVLLLYVQQDVPAWQEQDHKWPANNNAYRQTTGTGH